MNWKPIKAVDYLVVHCSATPSTMDIGAEEIRRWHRQKGWLDIGYHYVIRRDGTVETGRPETRPGAHARGYNERSLGVCLVGGVEADGKTPEANYTDDQMTALAVLLDLLEQSHEGAEVVGHRDLPGVSKACPCFDAPGWYYGVGVRAPEDE